ncbi:MAG: pyruvate, phosphate dikinase [Oligoflexia bacterium]|nr:pyruvate, phosphate dikinase [Oligoflexia bacterium]
MELTQKPSKVNAMADASKAVFYFGKDGAEGNASMKSILGGKGANLAEMISIGIPVPPGFTVATTVCGKFYEAGKKLPETVWQDVLKNVSRLEIELNKKFGDVKNPLLLSVRSGARASMPGMMDTILNLGLNDETTAGLALISNNPRFAYDSYRRFIQMYSHVVMNMNGSILDIELEDLKDARKIQNDTDLTAEELKKLCDSFKKKVFENTGKRFPTDPIEQLRGAISAVFESWNTPRAITYRKLHEIPESWGTAVNVQAMVFGNRGDDSATGVAFTRDPSTGEKKFFGEFLVNAQGEDVVAGIRTPQSITKIDSEKASKDSGKKLPSLEEIMPQAYKQLVEIYHKLEKHYRDMQDIEFTIEQNVLWMLQTRTGKRSAEAAVRIAIEMLGEKLITEQEALMRVEPQQLDQLLHPTLDPKAQKNQIARGLPASPGAACGQIVFTPEEAEKFSEAGKKCILVRVETSPEDIHGMIVAQGILTSRGGMTSHAAVVARGMGKCCVAGCSEIEVDIDRQELHAKGHVLKKGDIITLDGSTGEVFLGEVKTVEPRLSGNFDALMTLADKYRRLGIEANADTPHDARVARKFGAEGIGLCRTEHMFFDAERIDAVREMIVAENKADREKALAKLLPMQRSDFIQLFEEMKGFPVTIRLLDPPLHEFVPQADAEIEVLADKLGVELGRLKSKVKSLHEFNPMLGHRGCRLAVTYPEIYAMQARAIAEAAAELELKKGFTIIPEIMIPLINTAKEFHMMRQLVETEVNKVKKQTGAQFKYLVGTMIELPRAALTADEIAIEADFFSFGTNDLTQTTLGLSRDDAGKFLGNYVQAGLFEKDPFVSIDQRGVGQLVKLAVDLGRKSKPNLKVGVCGEHGGDPASVEFFHRAGLDYVSCSPYRVPIARLAAARAAIQK